MYYARISLATVLVSLGTCPDGLGAARMIDVRDHGARPDGETLCTAAIQAAIDRCAAEGGGTVTLPAGKWLSGTLRMKSHVTLWLGPGCTLLGSTDPGHYPPTKPAIRSYTDNYVCQSLIAGEDLENVAIRGRGTIDGNGAAFRWREYKNRPYLIRLVNCRDVLVQDVSLRNSAMWMQHYLACDRVRLSGISVWNHVTYNNDGVDIDGCHDVTIDGCTLDSDDDALCLKSTLDRACENVTITNCVISSHCNGIKTGTESNGGFRNITISNCTVCPPRQSEKIYGRQRGLAGIALEIVDGGHLDCVTISNIAIEGVNVPIFMRLGNRARPFSADAPKPGVGTFRNVSVSNIVATGTSNIGCSITGLPGHPIENVSISDIDLGFEGGGTLAHARREIPEKAESYPESLMFGQLSAYGFYVRHAKGLRLTNVRLRTAEPDARPALVLDDVASALVDGLDATSAADAPAVIRLSQVAGALIRGCRAPAAVGTFLRLEGKSTSRVSLIGNDLSRAARVVATGPKVAADVLSQSGNRLPAKP